MTPRAPTAISTAVVAGSGVLAVLIGLVDLFAAEERGGRIGALISLSLSIYGLIALGVAWSIRTSSVRELLDEIDLQTKAALRLLRTSAASGPQATAAYEDALAGHVALIRAGAWEEASESARALERLAEAIATAKDRTASDASHNPEADPKMPHDMRPQWTRLRRARSLSLHASAGVGGAVITGLLDGTGEVIARHAFALVGL